MKKFIVLISIVFIFLGICCTMGKFASEEEYYHERDEDNIYLSTLSLISSNGSEISFPFDKNNGDYNIPVRNSFTSIKLSATTESSKSILSISGISQNQSIDMSTINNNEYKVVTIDTHAPNGKTKRYTLTLTKLAPSPWLSVTFNNNEITNGSSSNLGNSAINTAVTYSISIVNKGELDLNVSNIMFTGTGFTVLNQSSVIGIISPNTTKSLNIQIQPTEEKVYSGTLTITSDDPSFPNYTSTLTASCGLIQNVVLDDFESGNFNAKPWTLSTSNPPTIQSTTVHSGSNAVEFFPTEFTYSSNNYNTISITINVIKQSTLTFYYKTECSSTSSYDDECLYFSDSMSSSVSFDDVNSNWNKYTCDLSVGLHTLSWKGLKYYSSTTYKAWLDDISINGCFTYISDINVKTASSSISNGSTYYMGGTDINVSKDMVFTIENKGLNALSLTGDPKISITGTNKNQFSVVSNVSSSVIYAGGSATFMIEFNSSSYGFYTSTVTITNDCPITSKSSYSFTLNAVCGILVDDFETGTLTGKPWTLTGSPTITSTMKNNGNYAVILNPTTPSTTYSISLPVYLSGGSGSVYCSYYHESSSYNSYSFYSSSSNNSWSYSGSSLYSGSNTITFSNTTYSDATSSNIKPFYIDDIYIVPSSGTLVLVAPPKINIKYGTSSISSGNSCNIRGNTGQDNYCIFTIENLGKSALTLNGSSKVDISGTNKGLFSITTDPSSSILPSSSTTFILRYNSPTSGSHSATLTISSDDPACKSYTINIYATSIARVFYEDFESNSLTTNSWTLGGNVSPFIQSTDKYEGSYAVRFGSIGNSQTSSMQITVSNTKTATLLFYYKVSSEPTYDKLVLYIDTTTTTISSGNNSYWYSYSLSLSPGTHTIKFEYSKDSSNAVGSDTAWLDNIEIYYP